MHKYNIEKPADYIVVVLIVMIIVVLFSFLLLGDYRELLIVSIGIFVVLVIYFITDKLSDYLMKSSGNFKFIIVYLVCLLVTGLTIYDFFKHGFNWLSAVGGLFKILATIVVFYITMMAQIDQYYNVSKKRTKSIIEGEGGDIQKKRIYEKINKTLQEDWLEYNLPSMGPDDPDNYSEYAEKIYKMLMGGKTKEQIVKYLNSMEYDLVEYTDLGLKTGEIVEKLLKIDISDRTAQNGKRYK